MIKRYADILNSVKKNELDSLIKQTFEDPNEYEYEITGRSYIFSVLTKECKDEFSMDEFISLYQMTGPARKYNLPLMWQRIPQASFARYAKQMGMGYDGMYCIAGDHVPAHQTQDFIMTKQVRDMLFYGAEAVIKMFGEQRDVEWLVSMSSINERQKTFDVGVRSSHTENVPKLEAMRDMLFIKQCQFKFNL